MNVDPVLIEDDDVVMEPVPSITILDEDGENTICQKVVCAQTVETINLDDESPIITETTANNTINKSISTSKSEKSFVNKLLINRLMDKIIKKCMNMDNATGMRRVIYKTVLPLYRDANSTFKESGTFRALLKKTYKLLMRDPDHKFLHIKTLCEELKSGVLRRKVPFVTLATNVNNNRSQWDHQELTSSSREINQYAVENRQTCKVNTNENNKKKKVGTTRFNRKAKVSKKCAVNTKKTIKTRSVTQAEKAKTDIIDLDDSDDESVDSSENDVIIIDEIEPSHQRNDNVNMVPQETGEAESKVVNQILLETLEAESENINKLVEEALEALETTSEKSKEVVHETLEIDCNIENAVVEDTIEDGSTKENISDNSKSSDNEMDYELLIPKSHVKVKPVVQEVPHSCPSDLKTIAQLEKLIRIYKLKIDVLEKTEVTTESPFGSPYYLCSKYKENVVSCYKEICKLRGNCEDINKRREIRLTVAEGHPPGPAKRLEEFLNSTINTTGAVEFPDFSEVVQCVVESNFADNLGWNRHRVMQEAVALFRQCGQALRKRRQKREYRDLLSWVQDNEETDDPAEKDPILLAKLEENKLIANVKEEEILERFVRMEKNASLSDGVLQVNNAVEFESSKSSSESNSDSETEHFVPNIPTSTVNNQPDTDANSIGNNSLDLLRININSTLRSNLCDTNLSSTNHSNKLKANPMLLNLLNTPRNCLNGAATNDNQCIIRENSLVSGISNNGSDMIPPNATDFNSDTVNNESEVFECSQKEGNEDSKLELTTTETVVGFNNTTSDNNSETSITNNERFVEKTEITAHNEPCNANDIQDQVSSTTDSVKVKIEDNVKNDPQDIQNMLDELGDNFVCQVFDIEDPFLVIEISSDDDTDEEL